MSGIAEVTARIAQIQGQLAQVSGARGASATGATAFADALTAAQWGSTDLSGLGGTAGGPTGTDVVTAAKKYLGVPYVFGGTDPKTGLDCSGLVQRVFADLGVELPRLVRHQRLEGQPVASMSEAKPGDLLVFDGYQHIGIYLGGGQMLHAPQPGENVKIGRVYETPTSIRRILPAESSGTSAGLAGLTGSTGLAGTGLLRSTALGTAGSLAGVPYANLFTQAAAEHGVSAALLAAVAKTESGYNPNAVSPAGAKGLMQIMPATARELGINPLDPAQAVDGAARLLKRHLNEFGSLPLALAAYNAGGGAVRKYDGVPPYTETQNYVVKVQAALAALGKAA